MFICFCSALEFSSTCKLKNLTVRAELGCCLLHRSGRLTIDGCILQCESNPLDHLSYAIVSTANACEYEVLPSAIKSCSNSVSVYQTRIEGGAKAVLTSGALSLQQVRVIYSRTSVFFWFDVEHRQKWFSTLYASKQLHHEYLHKLLIEVVIVIIFVHSIFFVTCNYSHVSVVLLFFGCSAVQDVQLLYFHCNFAFCFLENP